MPLVSDFTNANGTRLLGGLFLETTKQDKLKAPYTLKDYDYEWKGKLYPSLFLLYMAEQDVTEYRFAITHLVDWQHWELLSAADWFQPHLKRWRKELELSLKAEALARLLDESRKPGREGLSAAKYVLEKGWEPKDKNSKGRPSKDDIRKAAHQIATDTTQVHNDITRLGLLKADNNVS